MPTFPPRDATVAGRRRVLALSGAFVAGLAGCLGGDDDDGGDDDGNESAGGDPDDDGGSGDVDAPDFPDLDLATDPGIDEDLLARQVRGNVAFALDLVAQLRTDEPDANLFVSPYSVSVALATTYAGARGETATELAEALRYELEGEDLHAAFGALEAEFARRNEDGEELEGSGGEGEDGPAFRLASANALWGQEGFPFEEAFLDLVDAYYDAGMELVDFAGSPDEAREEINAWVAERTDDRIEDLLPEGSIDELTRLVLTNAIYFVAPWRHDFDPDATEPAPFTGLDGAETDVETMHGSFEVPYAEVDGHQLVELPYANGDTSLVVILPAEGEFESFEDDLTVDRLASMLEETSTPEVDLALPRFGVESKFGLVDVLGELGVELAFDPDDADFSGMSEETLFVDDVVHESFVEVDEEGTEAAAATAVVVSADAAPTDRVEVTVDRPFLFYIRDRPTETPLFLGRVVDGETL